MISWLEKNNKISWIITLFIAIIIFYLSSLTFKNKGSSSGNVSYIYHFSIFFLLGFFFLISIKRKNILIGILILFIYAISDEIHQLFVPGRSFSIIDIFTDFLGITISGIILIIPKIRNR